MGQDLVLRNNQGRMLMVTEVKEGAKFEAGVPESLFDMPNEAFFFDVSFDGRFIIPLPGPPG